MLTFIYWLLQEGSDVVDAGKEAASNTGKPIEFAMWINELLHDKWELSTTAVKFIKFGIMFIGLLVISWVVWFITRKILLAIVARFVKRSKTTWDDRLLEHRFFAKLAHIVPAIFVGYSVQFVLMDFPQYQTFAVDLTEAFIVGAIMMAMGAFLNALQQILLEYKTLKDKPIPSYIQLSKIILYFICIILMISLIFGKSPLYFLSAMGAMTAVILLIFKDTILGFVASIQLAANDMVRVGDWVTMEKYGADGDIIEINLATVKVRNFDRTITTIPTYAFIADSFKNWRGMEESPGRRIKRSISVKASSIKFCDEAMITRFKKYDLVRDYIEEKQKEIAAYNANKNVDGSVKVNGRNLTNIGVFRAYIQHYLEANPHINHEMTCMVRQLPTTELGLPIELYAFSADKDWVNYEGIVADIFDHILAIVPDFELDVFQNPTGADFAAIAAS